jgi:integrase
MFRKTAATILDEAGLTARAVADQLGEPLTQMTRSHGPVDDAGDLGVDAVPVV